MAEPKPVETEKATDVEEDEELSALLDSAVKDFKTTEGGAEKKTDEKKEISVTKPTPPDSLLKDDQIRTAAARFEQNMLNFFSPGADGTFNMDQLGDQLSRLADASTQAAGFEASPDNEFSSIIAHTLRNLSENTENIQNPFSEEDLANMLGPLGNMSDNNELLPFMQSMMQNLLSKEILHPALSNIVEKYPSWLEENKDKVSGEELTRYKQQFTIMSKVCTELEKETPDDSEEVKRTRFDEVLRLMQDLQDCGQPPADLIGDMGPLLDEQGRPQMPPGVSPDQCSLQ